MSEARVDQHRRHVELNKGTVQNLLPEYFLGEYPKLVEFLEAYYEYSEVDSVDSFVNQIHDLFKIKSITSTSLTNLDKIIADIGNGLQSSSFFQQPRLMARLLANFYRAKGTQISVEQFFRAFFNESISIEYPKRNIIIVGESKIGFESQRYIQDDKRYQIFSILLKTGLSKVDYESLYLLFAHPAGFYLSADVVTVGTAEVGLRAGLPNDPLEVVATGLQVEGFAEPMMSAFGFNTLIMSDPSGDTTGSTETLDRYADVSLNILNTEFGTLAGVTNQDSPTLDDDTMVLSTEYETMDAVRESPNPSA
jgi:hypothetical protein